MTDIVKACKVHGELTRDEVYSYKQKNREYFDCKKCSIEYRLTHKEHRKKYIDQYYQNNRERICKEKICRERGITIDQYDNIFFEQGNCCKICNCLENIVGEKISRFYLDHDHKTGKIRSFLCQKCNTLLGNCCEDIKILNSAIKYLKYHSNALHSVA